MINLEVGGGGVEFSAVSNFNFKHQLVRAYKAAIGPTHDVMFVTAGVKPGAWTGTS